MPLRITQAHPALGARASYPVWDSPSKDVVCLVGFHKGNDSGRSVDKVVIGRERLASMACLYDRRQAGFEAIPGAGHREGRPSTTVLRSWSSGATPSPSVVQQGPIVGFLRESIRFDLDQVNIRQVGRGGGFDDGGPTTRYGSMLRPSRRA